jgi:hypothetical protein
MAIELRGRQRYSVEQPDHTFTNTYSAVPLLVFLYYCSTDRVPRSFIECPSLFVLLAFLVCPVEGWSRESTHSGGSQCLP